MSAFAEVQKKLQRVQEERYGKRPKSARPDFFVMPPKQQGSVPSFNLVHSFRRSANKIIAKKKKNELVPVDPSGEEIQDNYSQERIRGMYSQEETSFAQKQERINASGNSVHSRTSSSSYEKESALDFTALTGITQSMSQSSSDSGAVASRSSECSASEQENSQKCSIDSAPSSEFDASDDWAPVSFNNLFQNQQQNQQELNCDHEAEPGDMALDDARDDKSLGTSTAYATRITTKESPRDSSSQIQYLQSSSSEKLKSDSKASFLSSVANKRVQKSQTEEALICATSTDEVLPVSSPLHSLQSSNSSEDSWVNGPTADTRNREVSLMDSMFENTEARDDETGFMTYSTAHTDAYTVGDDFTADYTADYTALADNGSESENTSDDSDADSDGSDSWCGDHLEALEDIIDQLGNCNVVEARTFLNDASRRFQTRNRTNSPGCSPAPSPSTKDPATTPQRQGKGFFEIMFESFQTCQG